MAHQDHHRSRGARHTHRGGHRLSADLAPVPRCPRWIRTARSARRGHGRAGAVRPLDRRLRPGRQRQGRDGGEPLGGPRHGHQGREQPARRAQLRRGDLRLHRLQDQHAPHAVGEPLLPCTIVRTDQGTADDDPGRAAHRRQRLPCHVRRASHQPGLLRHLVRHRDGDGGHVHGHRHVHERLPRIARLHSSPRLRVPVHLSPVRRLLAYGATARAVVAGGGRHHHEHHRGGHGQHPCGAEPGRQPQGEGAFRRG